ncbi:hypothetical protein ANN_27587 [Periplaneta americana]|uniref:Uncharacterized protein n=1 Tax=Periplaneta americana TaxID=6978 RepID=A0ABQ8RWA9_PERAM|nr:hypothetical protein ANN_27587 [Periplaneta americana]
MLWGNLHKDHLHKRRANGDTARGARRTSGGRHRYFFRDSRGHKRSDQQDGAAYIGDNRLDRGYNSRGGQHRWTKCSSGVNGNNSHPARIEATRSSEMHHSR